MVRDIWNENFGNEAKEFWEYLETHPDTIHGYYQLNMECREVARRLREPLSTHKEFINKLKKFKVPYAWKNPLTGVWSPYPPTKNKMEKATRKRMKKGDKYQTKAVKNALVENIYLPELEMGIQDAMKTLLTAETLEDISKLIGFEDGKTLIFKEEIDKYEEKIPSKENKNKDRDIIEI